MVTATTILVTETDINIGTKINIDCGDQPRLVYFLDPNFKTLIFQTFFKNNNSLKISRLKVIKKVINRGLEKFRKQAILMLLFKCSETMVQWGHKRVVKLLNPHVFYWMCWLQARPREKNSLAKALIVAREKTTWYHFSRLYPYQVPRLFPGLENCFAFFFRNVFKNSRLCMNSG